MRDDCTGRRDPTASDLDCHAATRRLWDYLEGELRRDDARPDDRHRADRAKHPPRSAAERVLRALARDGFRRR